MKKILAILTLGLTLVGGLVGALPVMADGTDMCDDFKNDSQLYEAAGCQNTKRADEVVNGVMQVVFACVGLLAVGVMILGGVMYVTSVGDAQRAYRARNIILYGVIGLIVSLMAYAIVFFVSGALSGA